MYLCHFCHTMNAITELQLVSSVLIYLLVAQNSILINLARNLIRWFYKCSEISKDRVVILLNLIDVIESIDIWKYFFIVCEQIDGNKFLEDREFTQVQLVSAPFAYHEWCLESNEATYTVVYVRHPELAA
jgi:hypothetical protein